MSFLYETMKNRCPSKRKIKPKEENLLHLLSQLNSESEEDEDFKLPSEEKGETTSTSEDRSEKNGRESSPGEEIEVKIPVKKKRTTKRKRRKKKMLKYDSEIDSSVGENKIGKQNTKSLLPKAIEKCKQQLEESIKIVASKNISNDICCVCLTEKQCNKLTCAKCGLVIHNDCYGFPFTTITIVNNPKSTQERKKTWFCDKCVACPIGKFHFSCEFCPSKNGLLKESLYGQWAHVICSNYVLGKAMYYQKSEDVDQNLKNLYVKMESIQSKRYGSKECVLCEETLFSKTGIVVKCDAGFCNATFHVTCAQKHGLLVQNENSVNRNLDLDAYCPLHGSKSDVKAMQQRFQIVQNASKMVLEKYETNKVLQESLQILHMSSKKNYKRITMPKKVELKPRMLSSNAYFSEMLNKKAVSLYGKHVLNPDLQVPTPLEIRKKHGVVPAITNEYASYYADRWLRLCEGEQELIDQKNINQRLAEMEKTQRQIVERKRGSLLQLQSEGNELKNRIHSLKNLAKSMKHWSNQTVTSKEVFSKITPQICLNSPSQSTSGLRIVLSDFSVNHPEVILKHCGICKKTHNQHLLVKCDVCKEWQHLACLDPPLQQMPKRKKHVLWQCSECAISDGDSSSESVDTSLGSFIATDGRRLTTRSRKAPEKLLTKLLVEKTQTQYIESFGRKKKRRRKRVRKTPMIQPEHNESDDASDVVVDVVHDINITQTVSLPTLELVKTTTVNQSLPESIKNTVNECKPVKPKKIDIPQICTVCKQEDRNKKSLSCDTCNKIYHWDCCDPPIKSNPKRNRFHIWECTDCVSTSSSSDNDAVLQSRRRKVPVKMSDSNTLLLEQALSQMDEDEMLQLQ